ncbi:bifunctional metallophosphatase/5'-nucleotidase [Streptomyces sannanensis]|uniref:Bifunctional metallophosphatase/5'-nucleotidase n=1 Tax=Streptomyces sannanensis TaxID=285536 RepID=A0ABP6SBL9_9ACTN
MSPTSRTQRATRRMLTGAAGLAAAGALVAAAMPAAAAQEDAPGRDRSSRTVDVQLLSFNDLHGNLEPVPGKSGQVTQKLPDGGIETIQAGGVANLLEDLREARQGNEYSITAAAGDMIGASPLVSGLFHDEPTIEAMNGLGLDVAGVGNHEFDEGRDELLRMQNGGCHPKDGCFDGGYEEGKSFHGADFPYLAANVTDEKNGKPILAPYWVYQHKGVKIGFIGVTLEGTPDVVSAEGVKGLKFGDEVETINKYAQELDRQGVKAVVALVHEGGFPASGDFNYDCDSPGPGAGISGPIAEIAKNTTAKVDAFVTGHTHQAYVCNIPDPSGKPRLVTSAASFGRLYTDTTLTYDRGTRDIVRTGVESANHPVRIRQFQPGYKNVMHELIDRWNGLAAEVANRPVGYISADIDGRGAPTSQYEKPLGDVIADAQLEALAPADKGGAQLALMNPGGIRGDLKYTAESKGVVTYGDAFAVQPFTNMMNVVDLTGAQLITALQQQVSGANQASIKILQVSKGFTYTLDMTKTGADRIVVGSVKLNGEPIDPAKTYRVAMNEFLSGGGDGFTVLKEHKNKLVGPSDLDAFTAYLTAHSSPSAPLAPPVTDRITVVR